MNERAKERESEREKVINRARNKNGLAKIIIKKIVDNTGTFFGDIISQHDG